MAVSVVIGYLRGLSLACWLLIDQENLNYEKAGLPVFILEQKDLQ